MVEFPMDVVSNSYDWNTAENIVYAAARAYPGKIVVHDSSTRYSSFDDWKSYWTWCKTVVLVGGPTAPEGMGTLVQYFLPYETVKYLIDAANRGETTYRIVTSYITGTNIVVYVLAGSNPNGTSMAAQEFITTYLTPPAPPTLVNIIVDPSSVTMNVGETKQFTATGVFSDGSRKNINVSWALRPVLGSLNPVFNSYTTTFKSDSPGTCEVQAYIGNVVGYSTVVINAPQQPPQPPGGPTLQFIEVSPTSATIDVGQSVPFTAYGTYSDGTKKAVYATWSIYPQIGTLSATSGYNTIFTASKTGSASLTAKVDTKSATAYINVKEAVPTIISVDTTPIKGDVYIDGELKGKAPVSVKVTAGTHVVSFGDVPGYIKPSPQTISIASGQTKSVTGEYHVSVSPPTPPSPAPQIPLDYIVGGALVAGAAALAYKATKR